MKRLLLVVCLAVMAGGCAQKHSWTAINSSDKFADTPTAMVTIGDYGSSSSFLFTSTLHYYPFVEKRGNEITVGVRSGGRYKVPTGTVQLRIDSNKAWTIEPSETPLYLVPASVLPGAMPMPPMPPMPTMQGTSSAQREEYAKQMKEYSKNSAQYVEDARENANKIMSPFTAATGEKAKAIAKEMMMGQKIIYRKVGVNQAASSEGSANLDQSFKDAMAKAGITMEMLD